MNSSFLLFWLPLHQNPSPFLKLQNQNFHVLFDQSLSRVWLFVTPWTVAHQALLPMGFSRQEYWSGLPFPTPGVIFPTQGVKLLSLASPVLASVFFTTSTMWEASANIHAGKQMQIFSKKLFFFSVILLGVRVLWAQSLVLKLNTWACSVSLSFFFSPNNYVYLFIWGCAGSSVLHELFSGCGEQGLLPSYGARASHCGGFSCCRARALEHTDFSSWSRSAQGWFPGSTAVA